MTQPSRSSASRTAHSWRSPPPRRTPSACGRAGLRPALATRGFTLVELLVVIAIIGTLMGLLTPAVMRALASSRNAAIKSEIDMLHMALMNYKSEYGVLPPSIDISSAAARHLKRLFPRCPSPAAQLANRSSPLTNGARPDLTPASALTLWLGGFTPDPQSPLIGARQKLFDFDAARITATNGFYAPRGKPLAPYIYIPASEYALMVPSAIRFSGSLLYSGTNSTELGQPGAHLVPVLPLPAKASAYPEAWWFTNTNAPLATIQSFFNADTFQILCAGADQEFGNDDDLSNFWPGTRKEYLESLPK